MLVRAGAHIAQRPSLVYARFDYQTERFVRWGDGGESGAG
jgi:hypothetical protein